MVRAAGRIPAIIYGKSSTPLNLELDYRDFDNLVHAAHSEIILVDLTIEGENSGSHLALVQDVQHHALTGKVLHVDFHEVKPDEKVTVQVPVESTGEAVGVKISGGVLEHVLFKLKVRALPKDLPDQIVVDVSHMEAGKTIHIREITAPEGVEILGNPEIPVFAVAAALVPVADAAAPAATKQPEMLKEKKDAKK